MTTATIATATAMAIRNVESAAIIPLGWPDREYGPNRRPPLERFVMRDRWSG